MAVSVGVLTTHPALLPCQLQRVSPQVHLHPRAGRVTTVGLASVTDGTLLLRRFAPADAPRTLVDEAFAEPAGALLYRAEALAPSASPETSGQPLRFQRWLFAQAGHLEAWPAVQAFVESELPPHLLTQVGTRTPAAAAFSLFLKALRSAERADKDVRASEAAQLLLDVARLLAERSAKEGAARSASLLLLATDARCLLAARLGDAPLYFRLLEGSPLCGRCALPSDSRGREAAAQAHAQSRAVVVATAPDDGAHWLELPAGRALAVGPTLEPLVLPSVD